MPKKVDEASEQELMESEMEAAANGSGYENAAEADEGSPIMADADMAKDSDAPVEADAGEAAEAEPEASASDVEAEAAADEAAPAEEPKPAAPSRRRRNRQSAAAAEGQEQGEEQEAPAQETPPRGRRRRSRSAENADAAEPAQEGAEDGKEAAQTPNRQAERIRRQNARAAKRQDDAAMAATWQSLLSARHQRVVLDGHVVSIDRVAHADGKPADVMVNVFIKGIHQEPALTQSSLKRAGAVAPVEAADLSLLNQRIKVSIPFFTEFSRSLGMEDLGNLSTEEGRRAFVSRQESYARRFLNMDIPFIITDMDLFEGDDYAQAGYSIRGSRRQALPILSRRFFEPIRGNQPIIQVGDDVSARVLSVSPHTLQVTVAGVDVRVPDYMLTFKYIPDYTQYYPNDPFNIRLRVVDIRKRDDGQVSLSLSGRALELERAKVEAPKILSRHSLVRGTFVQVNSRPDGRCSAIAWLDDIEAPAYVRSFSPQMLGQKPMPGRVANLTVYGFSEQGFVVTTCTGLVGDSASVFSGF